MIVGFLLGQMGALELPVLHDERKQRCESELKVAKMKTRRVAQDKSECPATVSRRPIAGETQRSRIAGQDECPQQGWRSPSVTIRIPFQAQAALYPYPPSISALMPSSASWVSMSVRAALPVTGTSITA